MYPKQKAKPCYVMDEEDRDCVLCQVRGATFDGMLCSSCAHEMWEYADEIRDIVGVACDICNEPYYMEDSLDKLDESLGKLDESVKLLREKMGT